MQVMMTVHMWLTHGTLVTGKPVCFFQLHVHIHVHACTCYCVPIQSKPIQNDISQVSKHLARATWYVLGNIQIRSNLAANVVTLLETK